MTMLAIETDGLSKTFEPPQGWRKLRRSGKGITAVQNVSLRIPAGELFGLLGPNGAGKTTLTKLLCTLILPTAGQAHIAGNPLHDTRAIRTAVGLVVTDERSFYWRLSGQRNLQFFAALHGLYGTAADERIHHLLQTVGLGTAAERRFSDYSSGMKQRLAIARALLHQPQILFLDEPSRSLDPTATFQLQTLIKDLQAQGVTIFLITHDLAEAEKLCERVAVMYAGEVQVVGDPALLYRQLNQQRQYTLRLAAAPPAALPDLHPILPSYETAPTEDGDW
ncbi:MAG: ABC transporter ATP-binding protein, partial [Anaerolineales bacterium]|nr:ABC transporter ATP-binding protein [Anaerolineales bacterium]